MSDNHDGIYYHPSQDHRCPVCGRVGTWTGGFTAYFDHYRLQCLTHTWLTWPAPTRPRPDPADLLREEAADQCMIGYHYYGME